MSAKEIRLISMKQKNVANVKLWDFAGTGDDFSFIVEAKGIEQLGGIGNNSSLVNIRNSLGLKKLQMHPLLYKKM